MSNTSYQSYLRENQYEIEKNVAYGLENDYLITIYQDKRYKYFIIPLPSITEEEKKRVLNYLKLQKKEFKLVRISFDNTVLILKVKEGLTSISVEMLKDIINTVTKFLKEQQIAVGKHCIFCGKDNANKKIKITRIQYYMHQSCYDKAIEGIEKEKEKEGPKKDRGFLGALIGTFIISIPWILLGDYSWFVGFITFLFASFAFKFYLMFNGKLTKNTKLLIALATIIVTIVSEILILVINNITLSELFTNTNRELLLTLQLGLLMSIIGLLPILRQFKYMNVK